MSIAFKIVLIVCAVGAFAFMLRKIRKSEIKIADATFWFLFAGSLVVLAIFPGIVFFLSGLLGIESPANFVYLYVVAVLVVRLFNSTVEISQLRNKVSTLAQEKALEDADEDKK